MTEERTDDAGRTCRLCRVWLTCETIDALAARAREEGLSDAKLQERIAREYLESGAEP